MTTAAPAGSLSFSTLLRQPVTDCDGHRMGLLADLVVRLRLDGCPLVTGLVVAVAGTRAFVTAADFGAAEAGRLRLAASISDLHEFRRREGEVLLSEDVLGHRLIDARRAMLVKAYDVRLSPVQDGWAATGLDVHQLRWLSPGPHHAAHAPHEWKDFDPLIGHAASAHLRADAGRLASLKPAQIAGIIEEATEGERAELFARLYDDPEVTAEVFEELDGPF